VRSPGRPPVRPHADAMFYAGWRRPGDVLAGWTPQCSTASKERFQSHAGLAYIVCRDGCAFNASGSRVAAALRRSGQVLDSVNMAFDERRKSRSNGARRKKEPAMQRYRGYEIDCSTVRATLGKPSAKWYCQMSIRKVGDPIPTRYQVTVIAWTMRSASVLGLHGAKERIDDALGIEVLARDPPRVH